MAKNTTTLSALKSLQKKLVKHLSAIGLDEKEIDGRVKSMIPNIQDMGVGTLGGNKVNLSYVLPWNLDNTFIKKKKFAEDIAETHPDNVVIKEVGLSLYILDPNDEELEVSIMVDVKWVHTFFGQLREDSYTIIEDVIKINQGGSTMSNNVEAQPIKTNLVMQEFLDKIVKRPEVKLTVKIDKYTPFPVSFVVNYPGYKDFVVSFEDNATRFRAHILIDSPFMELQAKTMAMFDYLKQNNFNASQEGMGIVVRGQYVENSVDIIHDIAKLLDAVKNYKVKANTQDLGGVAHKSLAAEVNDHDLFINSDTFKTVKNILLSDGFNQTDINGYVSFIKDNTQHGYSVWIRLRKNNKFDAHITVTNTDHLKVLIDSLKGLKFTKTDDLMIKFANDVTFSKIMVNSILNIIKKFDSSLDVFTVANTLQPDKQDLGSVKPNVPSKEKAPKEEIEPPNREVERTFKASKVKDPEHKEQLNRMKAYIKKIADVVDADNDFALRFLEEPKEFQKYKLPTVGVGLFYYGDKSISELEQNPLYKKVYRGRGLSILRKFFKTTDLNGEPCLLVLFVDNEYAKQSKAKLIKEALENNTTIKINGRAYKVKAILEKQCIVESVAGDLYIDIYSDLIDLI